MVDDVEASGKDKQEGSCCCSCESTSSSVISSEEIAPVVESSDEVCSEQVDDSSIKNQENELQECQKIDKGSSDIEQEQIESSASDVAEVIEEQIYDEEIIETKKEEEIPFYERPVVKVKKRQEIEPFSDEQKDYPWYVVNAYSGFEKRAKLNLEENIRSNGLVHKFGQIIVPEEKVVELVRGEKKTSSRKFYPGYMLVQCILDDETWHLVKDTEKITGFIGDARNPVPLSKKEVDSLMKQMEGGTQRSRPTAQFEQGDSVKVIDGPFMDFNGTVEEVKPDKGKLKVLISIFGRNTPVELDFVQVEKV